MFSHYSLFDSRNGGCQTIADFAPIPGGDVTSLIGAWHANSGVSDPGRICQWPKCCVHPGGHQVSFEAGGMMLILFDQRALADQAAELSAEGNEESAKAARGALETAHA